MLRNTDKSNATRHIVVRTLRERGRIVMRRENDLLVYLTGEINDNVLRFTLVFSLL